MTFRAFLRIIAEEQITGHWLAWFADAPTVSSDGECVDDAVESLMEWFGWDELEAHETAEVSLASSPGHREFRVPLKRYRWIPPISLN
jgi:hypothetical protein